jgi:hypothetical protein
MARPQDAWRNRRESWRLIRWLNAWLLTALWLTGCASSPHETQVFEGVGARKGRETG